MKPEDIEAAAIEAADVAHCARMQMELENARDETTIKVIRQNALRAAIRAYERAMWCEGEPPKAGDGVLAHHKHFGPMLVIWNPADKCFNGCYAPSQERYNQYAACDFIYFRPLPKREGE